MRTLVGVALVMVCLGLAGCSLFGKNKAARKDSSKPFLGSEAPAKTETVAIPRDTSAPAGANGLLAGQVVVEATERPIKAYISIKNLTDREDAKGADLDVSTNEEGYFTISNLKAGNRYELIVRANENGELISRTVFPKPPDPTLLIQLDKRFTTANTPAPPDMPPLPGKKSTAGTGGSKETKPSVSIDPPQRLEDQGQPAHGGVAAPSPAAGSGLNPTGGVAPNPANIAEGGGFRRMAQPAETISIPPPPPQLPSQPQWEAAPNQPPTIQSTPPGSVRMPAIQTPVPSCGLYGNRLDNLALYDLDGKVWEYKRDGRRARLMLLDFWAHNCHHCLLDIHNLVELQRDFGRYGLEVIGIACEMGTVEEQRQNVRPMCVRYGVNYRTLLSGGQNCPVMSQFQVEFFPLLVLIDSDGTILWRSTRDGMDERKHYALRTMINNRLVTQQSQP